MQSPATLNCRMPQARGRAEQGQFHPSRVAGMGLDGNLAV